MTYNDKAAMFLINFFSVNCSRVDSSLPVEQRLGAPPLTLPTAPMPPQTGPLARLLEGLFCGK